jgi:hypothetical protein
VERKFYYLVNEKEVMGGEMPHPDRQLANVKG